MKNVLIKTYFLAVFWIIGFGYAIYQDNKYQDNKPSLNKSKEIPEFYLYQVITDKQDTIKFGTCDKHYFSEMNNVCDIKTGEIVFENVKSFKLIKHYYHEN